MEGDQSDVENVNPEILGMTAEIISSKIEPSDYNNYTVDNCPEETESLLPDGFGERGKWLLCLSGLLYTGSGGDCSQLHEQTL